MMLLVALVMLLLLAALVMLAALLVVLLAELLRVLLLTAELDAPLEVVVVLVLLAGTGMFNTARPVRTVSLEGAVRFVDTSWVYTTPARPSGMVVVLSGFSAE